MLKVFLAGDGDSDRAHVQLGADKLGVVEALLLRIRPHGWRVAGAQSWRSIRKYRAGAARDVPDHGEVRNTHGLALKAYEERCDLLVLVHDVDDEHRERATEHALEALPTLGLAAHHGYELAIVRGVAKPKLEGWILCLLGVADTDAMSPARADRELAAATATTAYRQVAETRDLPRHDCSLSRWLIDADSEFRRLIDGVVTL